MALTISHGGGPGVYPEHSWEAKSGSIASGFIPEFDLRLLADGPTLVNCHDVTVGRTMNNIGTGPVSSKTVSQWQRARIKPAIPGGAEGRPVFWDEVLDRWAGRVVLVAELKDPSAVDVFLDSVLSRGVAPSILAKSFDLATAPASLPLASRQFFSATPRRHSHLRRSRPPASTTSVAASPPRPLGLRRP